MNKLSAGIEFLETAEEASVPDIKFEKCACGGEAFVLVNRMEPDAEAGISFASKMYECTECGAFRLYK